MQRQRLLVSMPSWLRCFPSLSTLGSTSDYKTSTPETSSAILGPISSRHGTRSSRRTCWVSFVKEAARLAEERPLDLGARFSSSADALFRGLVSLCYWLGQRSNDGEFFLSCRDAGDALGISPQTANQLLHRAEKLSFIESAGSYSEKNRARREAKTWRSLAAPLKTKV